MQGLKRKIERLSETLNELKKSLNLEEKKKEFSKLETESADPKLWDNQERARRIMQKLGDLNQEIEEIEKLEEKIKTLSELSEVKKTEKRLEKLKLKSLLSGPYDAKNAMISIHAGQGGVEAMDWTNMLYRMYLKFCESRGWKTQTLDMSPGEEAGLKSVTFKAEGSNAYGYLKGEVGTHRLVRQSPFNADKLRQTSFASVEVLPEFEEVDLPDIKIKDEDLKWQFFRASAQGGQNVQKVSTAVRVKHKPTGITVTSQTERSQEQNRKIALGLLRSKIWLLEQEKAQKREKEIKGEYKPASWGTQIRSYVLHPYKMVKDLRTEVETSDTDAVLGGKLDEFIEAELKLH
ncbi:peptide chain release factor 2 [Candidatus Woesebacteria bacterium]|nr:peptide chain release factor 2 [Candidatus Woesebacteria bacterium]